MAGCQQSRKDMCQCISSGQNRRLQPPPLTSSCQNPWPVSPDFSKISGWEGGETHIFAYRFFFLLLFGLNFVLPEIYECWENLISKTNP